MRKNKLQQGFIFIFIPIIVLLVGIGAYIVYKSVYLKQDENKANRALAEATPFISNTQTGKGITETGTDTLKNKEFTISLPAGMKGNDKYTSGIYVQTLDEIIKDYDRYKAEGCPGACGTLIENNNLQKQFDILKLVGSLTDCRLDDSVKESAKDFILFNGGIGTKEVLDVIWNENLKTCGLKFVGADGYDAAIENYEYEVGFLVKDKIIRIRFELFPRGVFPEVDTLLTGFGLSKDGACNEKCFEKEYEYMESINYESPLLLQVIKTYDTSVKSFSLNK